MRNKCHQNSGKENSQSLSSSSPQLSNLFIVVNTEETVLNACGVGGGVVVVVVAGGGGVVGVVDGVTVCCVSLQH